MPNAFRIPEEEWQKAHQWALKMRPTDEEFVGRHCYKLGSDPYDWPGWYILQDIRLTKDDIPEREQKEIVLTLHTMFPGFEPEKYMVAAECMFRSQPIFEKAIMVAAKSWSSSMSWFDISVSVCIRIMGGSHGMGGALIAERLNFDTTTAKLEKLLEFAHQQLLPWTLGSLSRGKDLSLRL